MKPVKHEIIVCCLTTTHKGAQKTKHDITVLRASNMNSINGDSKSLVILFIISQCKKFSCCDFKAFEISPLH